MIVESINLNKQCNVSSASKIEDNVYAADHFHIFGQMLNFTTICLMRVSTNI